MELDARESIKKKGRGRKSKPNEDTQQKSYILSFEDKV